MCLICTQLDKFGDWEDALGMVYKARIEAAVSGVNAIPEEHLEEVEEFANAIKWIEQGNRED